MGGASPGDLELLASDKLLGVVSVFPPSVGRWLLRSTQTFSWRLTAHGEHRCYVTITAIKKTGLHMRLT
ncbi:hypothetical protein O3P69_010644 [Scylla paramamosain]|uniref:Uncharacterized protein n=1 Tax=Scylla paramamosain TaxID=85552 RepID=A0AAW0TI06_SCYPA